MTVAIVVLCAVVGIYLYVMGLCHLCDLYERRQKAKQDEEEKRQKEKLLWALNEAEIKKKAEIERRKQMAKARSHKGQKRAQKSLRRSSGPMPTQAAHG